MKLVAKNDKELDICLKMLYSKGLNNFPITVAETEKGKIYFEVPFSVTDETFEKLEQTYKILIAK